MGTAHRLILPLLLLALYCQTLRAHEAGITDTAIDISRDGMTLVYTVPQALIDTLETVDDAAEEASAVNNIIIHGVAIANGNVNCTGKALKTQLLEAIDSQQFTFKYDCGGPITELHINYNLFFEHDPDHSNIVRITLLELSRDFTLTADKRSHSLDVLAYLKRLAATRQIAKTQNLSAFEKPSGMQYFPVGVEHILFGFDHVLFIICLVLLPMRPLQILALITAFTIAHTITLSLSVLDLLTLPPRGVELAIAFSVIVVSGRTLTLLQPSTVAHPLNSVIRERIVGSFLFGLIHGFGFSYILREIGLGQQLASSLLFFNLGVEVGQLVILVLLLPLIFWLGNRFPSMRWAQATAIVTGSIGVYWFIQRLTNY